MLVRFILSVAAIAWSGSAAAGDLVLAPSSDWQLADHPDGCSATRDFGSGKNRTTLRFDKTGPEPHYKLTLIGHPLRNPYGAGIRVQFGPEEKESVRSYIHATSGKGFPAMVMYSVYLSPPNVTKDAEGPPQPLGREREAAITYLRLSAALSKSLRLETGPLDATMERLRACALRRDAQLEWYSTARGGDARPPQVLNGDAIGQTLNKSYPAYLARAQMGAEMQVRLTVNERGKPTACAISGSTRPQLFEDTLCLNLLKTGKFEPALDMAGQPVAAYYRTRVKFTVQ